ncbi:MAG TPA: DUF4105 domain-containing protein [Chitinophagaceae bacterium]|nr:DUF4105 domain-containing protein [Chitinophagaceae bacterium]
MPVFNKCLIIIFLIFILQPPMQAQPDSCRLRISLLTCGPGQDLYSIWGHTGIRFTDSTRQADVVFNYGTFDDSDPLFYVKFTRGIMMYAVAPYSYQDFMQEYIADKRSVTEQVLHLSCEEKIKLAKALWNNTKEENKFYPYHFYADNCTTRARDIILNNIDTAIHFKDIRPRPGSSTYRQLIHSYMNSSSQAWNRFGIDVLLGNHLDEAMTNKQAMFLPDYLMKGFDSATLRQQAWVSETNILLPNGQPNNTTFFTPVFLFSSILVIMLALSFAKNKTAAKTLGILDSLFFLLTGLLGMLMLVLWLARVDMVCRNNYNILWALPTHTIIAFVITKQKKWIKYYWLATAIINALLLLTWNWLPQEMNNSILLLVTILLFRSIVRYRKINRA